MMILQYFPTEKIAIDGIVLNFDEPRQSVRSKLGRNYREDNQIIPLGGDDQPIYQRRDIYENTNASKNYFFLSYNRNDLLSEIEVHNCDKIKIYDIFFDFEDDLDSIASQLNEYSSMEKKDDGEYFFKELKTVIMDKNKMGGIGTSLGYFYCTSDVSHHAIGDDSF